MKSHHWLAVALERYLAGEPEADVLRDYGYVRESEMQQALQDQRGHTGCRVNERRAAEEIERLRGALQSIARAAPPMPIGTRKKYWGNCCAAS